MVGDSVKDVLEEWGDVLIDPRPHTQKDACWSRSEVRFAPGTGRRTGGLFTISGRAGSSSVTTRSVGGRLCLQGGFRDALDQDGHEVSDGASGELVVRGENGVVDDVRGDVGQRLDQPL